MSAVILYYIDESGTGLKDNGSHYFLLAAVAIKETDWSLIDSKINELKRNIVPWAKPEDFEIKCRDIRRGKDFFKTFTWQKRVEVINKIAIHVEELPCRIYVVIVNKASLPESISSDEQMYRLSFWRLLDEIEICMRTISENGLLMVDSRSDQHSSIQDRRLIDTYRDWVTTKKNTRFIELPWFGFSAFYAGLQLADFCAYMIDFVSNEKNDDKERTKELHKAYAIFKNKIHVVTIP
jgi:hypothetical protein